MYTVYVHTEAECDHWKQFRRERKEFATPGPFTDISHEAIQTKCKHITQDI